MTVLGLAMEEKDPEEAVKLLVDCGISVDIRDDHGQDMLRYFWQLKTAGMRSPAA